MIPVGQGNTGVRGYCRCRGHARHDFKGYMIINQFFRFLAAPTEDERVSALEPGHNLSLIRPLDDQRVDLVLGQSVFAALLAYVNQLRVRPALFKETLVRKIVIDNHIGLSYTVKTLYRYQSRIPGSRADEIYFSF